MAVVGARSGTAVGVECRVGGGVLSREGASCGDCGEEKSQDAAIADRGG